MLNLTGYIETDLLYTGTRTIVYRARRTRDARPVIIKVLRNPHPNFNELVQFRNQYIITRHLEDSAIVRPLALERYGNGYALVMPDTGEVALKDYWQLHEVSLPELLAIGIQLAEVLHYLILERIVHKDIKPSNILIHPETHQVKVIDFSISSLLPKEQQQLANPNLLEGTLAYISPEQTGRMNRGIDYRTDFYSLGVTFFELLTGKLPFETSEPMELVHCHIARAANFPARSQVPAVLQEIVKKLMAKNAEDRYQSALGLKYDLERCLEELEATGEIATFEIGERDRSDRFLIPERLYGRKTEVQTLLDAFDRVAGGQTEMMLVAGFSGIGKTAVVNEVHKPIVEKRGYFIKGKYDQLNRSIPFSAFVIAFRDLMGQLLGESDWELGAWKAQILEAVGENGQVIIDVIPELERIIGKQPPVAELSGSAAQNRFNLLFGKFIRVFSTIEHPLVIFLDDLQWADSASLNLLKLLMDSSEAGYLLVLGAYRDVARPGKFSGSDVALAERQRNEVFPAHPLMLTLSDIAKGGAVVNTLTLAPLEEVDITRLVADTLLCSVEMAAPLSQLVYQKTRGNPFFTTQFLKGLYEDGWIAFDINLGAGRCGNIASLSLPGRASVAGYWQCDLTQVRQLALTDDVVEFMVGRLQKLPEATQAVLKLAACIGNQFDLGTLAVVCECSQDEVAASLWTGLQEGFVLPQSQTYKFFQGSDRSYKTIEAVSVNYRFLHDRVQQAAYQLVPNELKATTHLNIGQLMLQNISPEEREEHLFDITNQLNLGRDLIRNRKQRSEMAELNLKAGQKALASIAYSLAKEYLETAAWFLESDRWQTQYSSCFEIYRFLAEVEYLLGDFQRSEELINDLLDKARTTVEKADLYRLLIIQLTMQNSWVRALDIGLEALSVLDITLDRDNLEAEFEGELQQVDALVLQLPSLQTLTQLPPLSSHPEIGAAMKVLSSIHPLSYLVDKSLFNLLVLKAVNLSLSYGQVPESAPSYSWYSLILGSLLGDYQKSREFGEIALRLAVTFDSLLHKCQAFDVYSNFCSAWVQPLKGTVKLNEEALQAAIDSGEFPFAGYIMIHQIFNAIYLGFDLNEIYSNTEKYLSFLEKISHHYGVDAILGSQLAIKNLMGLTESALSFDTDKLTEIKYLERFKNQNFYGLCRYLVLKARILYWHSAYDEAWKTILAASEKLPFITSTISVAEYHFIYCLVVIACWHNFGNEERAKIEGSFKVSRNQIKTWSDNCPQNFLHKLLLVEAEYHRINNDVLEAIELYDRAIAGAKENDFIQEEALANELAAKFYLEWGKEKFAVTYMQEAYYCYARWGAKAKTDELEAKYPKLLTPILQQQRVEFNPIDSLETIAKTLTAVITEGTQTGTHISEALDFAAILLAAQTLCSTIELDELLANIVRIILSNAGAQKAVLLVPEGEQWQVRAMARLIDPRPEVDRPGKFSDRRRRPGKFSDSVARPGKFSDSDVADAERQRVVADAERQRVVADAERQRVVADAERQEVVANASDPEVDRGAILPQGLSPGGDDSVETSTKSQPLTAESPVPVRLVQYVKNMQKPVLIDEAKTEITGILQGYILKYQPQSAFCVPLVYRGNVARPGKFSASDVALAERQNLVAILYLEHRTTKGVFTRNRQTIIKFLCAQAAIALENAKLYERAQQALMELKQAQLQLIQSEKMSALGNLVSGIAHEINNPIGFLKGNLQPAQNYTQDLLSLIDLLLEKVSGNDPEIETQIEEVDLEFIRQDLPELLESMNIGVERIRNISNSLRTFSRTDVARKVAFNLDKGIDSSLLILKHRMKANQERPAIKIIKDYGEMQEVECLPGQLNQVFMNILANAIDAFDEANQGKTYSEIEANPNCITIRTAMVENSVEITIKDNGCGMKPETKERIFEQGFTTKGVGKGTGLGMAIARNIITEKHGGTITCDSKLGVGTTFTIALPMS